MKTNTSLLLVAAFLSVSLGCDLRRLGPPLYGVHAAEYLEKRGFSSVVIEAVVDLKPLDAREVAALLSVPDVSVKHMLGRNPHLTRKQRDVLLRDPDPFVRQGVALNHTLSREEIDIALSDTSRYVLSSLAMNPAVPSESLLILREEHGIALSDFAQNPKCPPTIVKEIEARGSSLERDLLAITRQHHGGEPRAE